MSFRDVYAIHEKLINNLLPHFVDIEVLKRKKLKIEIEIATDDKNKETIANQIRLLTEKLDEIDQRQQSKRLTLAKIDDTLTQSEIGKISTASSIAQFQDSPISGYSKIIDSLQVLLNFAASKTDLDSPGHH